MSDQDDKKIIIDSFAGYGDSNSEIVTISNKPRTEEEDKQFEKLKEQRLEATESKKREMIKALPKELREFVQNYHLMVEKFKEIESFEIPPCAEEARLKAKNAGIFSMRDIAGIMDVMRYQDRHWFPPAPNIEGLSAEKLLEILNEAALEDELMKTDTNNK